MPEEPIDERKLSPLEADLASLVPRAATCDRDALMFQAGRAEGEQERAAATSWLGRSLWPLATAASMCLAMASTWWGFSKPPQIAERIASLAAPAAEPPAVVAKTDSPQSASPTPGRRMLAGMPYSQRASWQHATGEARAYLQLRDQLVASGFEAFPLLPSRGNTDHIDSDSLRDIRKQFFRSPQQDY
jgi:hypothetical protein